MADMMKLIPTYYRKSKIMQTIVNVLEAEINAIGAAAQLLNMEFCIDTANETIGRWETGHGLQNTDDDIYKRRARIKAKMRGTGTMTKKEFENLLKSYTGEVDITVDAKNSAMHIALLDIYGIPRNNDDILYAIEEFKPAHLAYVVQYSFNTWQAAANKFSTWESVKNMTFLELASYYEETQEEITNGGNK